MSDAGMVLLECLFEGGTEPRLPLPEDLARLYGGPLHLARSSVFANFVASIDGVVRIRGERASVAMIGRGSEADHFVMALLRASAHGVLVGATTLRDAPGHRWTAQGIYPALRDSFADLRNAMGLEGDPGLAVLTASGVLDPTHPALRAGAMIITTSLGAARLDSGLPPTCEVVVLGDGPMLDVGGVLAVLRSRGWHRILSEAGPAVTGQLLDRSLLDDLFVTQSPVLVGGTDGDSESLAGAPRVPGGLDHPATLCSVRRHGSYLFVRYHLAKPASQ